MISISKNDIEKAVNTFQKNMSTALNKEWYITFYTAQKVIVVFRDRMFPSSGEGITPNV